jgi:hypothetical protein
MISDYWIEDRWKEGFMASGTIIYLEALTKRMTNISQDNWIWTEI